MEKLVDNVENIAQDDVFVKLDKIYRVRFTMSAFKGIAKKFGSVQAALEPFYSSDHIVAMSPEYLDVLVELAVFGLACNKEELTREKLEDLIDSKNIFDLNVAIRKAVSIHVPQAKDGTSDPQ